MTQLIPLTEISQCYSTPEVIYGDYVLIRDIKAILSKHKVKWWLDGGSLIGLLRHNSVIPFDDDVDLCMLYEDFYRILPELRAQFEQWGYVLKAGKSGKAVENRHGQNWPTYYQFFVTAEKCQAILHEMYPTLSPKELAQRTRKAMKQPLPYGDFLLMEDIGGGKIQYLGDYYGNKPYIKSTIFPLGHHRALGESIPIPRKPISYLMNSYNSQVSPVTNAVIWNVHAPKNNPICNERHKVDMLDAETLASMNRFLKKIFGKKISATTPKSLAIFQH